RRWNEPQLHVLSPLNQVIINRLDRNLRRADSSGNGYKIGQSSVIDAVRSCAAIDAIDVQRLIGGAAPKQREFAIVPGLRCKRVGGPNRNDGHDSVCGADLA